MYYTHVGESAHDAAERLWREEAAHAARCWLTLMGALALALALYMLFAPAYHWAAVVPHATLPDVLAGLFLYGASLVPYMFGAALLLGQRDTTEAPPAPWPMWARVLGAALIGFWTCVIGTAPYALMYMASDD